MDKPTTDNAVDRLYTEAAHQFGHWEILKDLVDEMIDLMLNYRQSGHPGGSRSKVHLLLSTMLSGAMRWDLLRPWRPFGDRFVLSAGHTVPLVYATLAVLNEAMRRRHALGGEAAYAFPDGGKWALTYEDLLLLRRRHGPPGHAEMEGKTLFLKWNTGPSGHGMPPSAGEAASLKLAGCEEVKVFVAEGEGGLTPGASHETKNSAWGLGLSNLVFLIDWNNFGIDINPLSSVVHGTPRDWFEPYGWRVLGTEQGMEWGPVTRNVLQGTRGGNPDRLPTMVWIKTRKGRGYGKYDEKSHGTPWPMNSAEFWAVRKQFMEKYGVEYQGVDQPAPTDAAERVKQARANLEVAMGVLWRDEKLVDYTARRLVEVAGEVPDRVPTFHLGGKGGDIFADQRLYDFKNYPASVYKKPGDKQPNRAALAAWGACSTYGSFSYLKYGPMRLFSQLAQDCQIKVGKVLWVAGHSGPETAEDSRTHFGVFATGVTQLFPEGHVIDLHPWEYNEVPVVLGAALRTSVPIVALHLTRPAVDIPDRAALGMASHFEAARGAYVLRAYREGQPRGGTVFVQGTMSTANLVKCLPELDKAGLNVKIVAVISPQLFRMQEAAYRDSVASTADRWDAMCVTNRGRKLMDDWLTHPLVREYSLSSDWDDRWRTGGTVDEVIEEAHLDPKHILAGIERFVRDRGQRLRRLREAVEAVEHAR